MQPRPPQGTTCSSLKYSSMYRMCVIFSRYAYEHIIAMKLEKPHYNSTLYIYMYVLHTLHILLPSSKYTQ